jgi:hypothetical protein
MIEEEKISIIDFKKINLRMIDKLKEKTYK